MGMNATAPLDNYFKENKVEIVLFPENISKQFKTLKAFIDYFKNELSFWQKYNEGPFTRIYTYFNNIVNSVNAINPSVDDQPSRAILVQAINSAKVNKYPCVYSDTKAAKILTEQYSNNKKQAFAALAFISNDTSLQNSHNLQHYDTVRGVLDFYTLHETGSKVIKESDVLHKTLDELKQRYTNTLTEIDTAYNTKIHDIDANFLQRKNELDHWQEEKKVELTKLIDTHKVILEDIEKLYNEKLRLESSAIYWQRYSGECEKNGSKWRNWAIGATGFVVAYLTFILFKLPQTWLITPTFDFHNIKGILIFALIISLLIYLIRLFIRLSISSYHLARDAKERYELTYLYLSLLKEDAINPEDRNVVLSSLFSRADIGLLKGDSSPTMPEGLLKAILDNMRK